MKINEKKAQVWIETVIYILIGMALIALVLAFVMPKINQQRENAIVLQTIESLNLFDKKINEVIDAGKDNKRIVSFNMKAGEIYFNPQDNLIFYSLKEMNKPYSEPNIKIPVGRIIVESTEDKKGYSVNLTLSYEADLKFNEKEALKKFLSSSLPYKFSIENKGSYVNVEQIS